MTETAFFIRVHSGNNFCLRLHDGNNFFIRVHDLPQVCSSWRCSVGLDVAASFVCGADNDNFILRVQAFFKFFIAFQWLETKQDIVKFRRKCFFEERKKDKETAFHTKWDKNRCRQCIIFSKVSQIFRQNKMNWSIFGHSLIKNTIASVFAKFVWWLRIFFSTFQSLSKTWLQRPLELLFVQNKECIKKLVVPCPKAGPQLL